MTLPLMISCRWTLLILTPLPSRLSVMFRRYLFLWCGVPLLWLLRVSFVVLPPLFFRREYMIRPLRLRSNCVSFTSVPLLMPSPAAPERLLHPPFPLPPCMPSYVSAPHVALLRVSLDGRSLFSYPWLTIRSSFLLSPPFLRTLLAVALTLPRALGSSHVGSFLRARKTMGSDPLLSRKFFFGPPPLFPSGSSRLALSRAS